MSSSYTCGERGRGDWHTSARPSEYEPSTEGAFQSQERGSTVTEVAELERRLAGKLADLDATGGKLAELTGRLLDSSEGQRPKLLQERAALVVEGDALRAEVAELKGRLRLAELAPFEQAEAEAAALVETLKGRETKARVTLNAALDEQRRFLNARGSGLTREQHDKKEAEWAGKVAKLRAEGHIASDALRQAAFAHQHAHDRTAAMRESLGLG